MEGLRRWSSDEALQSQSHQAANYEQIAEAEPLDAGQIAPLRPPPPRPQQGKDKDSKNMTEEEKRAIQALGWTPESWDEGSDTTPFNRTWASLIEEDKEQYALLLGYTKDGDDFREDDHVRDSTGYEGESTDDDSDDSLDT